MNHPWIPITLWLLCIHTVLCIRLMLEVTQSFSASSCFLTFLTKIKSHERYSLLLMPFSLSAVACSWFDECLLHLFPLFFWACPQKSLYFVQGGSGSCQLTLLAHFHAAWHHFNTSERSFGSSCWHAYWWIPLTPRKRWGQKLSWPQPKQYIEQPRANWPLVVSNTMHELRLWKWIAYWDIWRGALEWLEPLI